MADRVEVAKQLLEAFANRDVDRLLSLCTADADFRTRVSVLDDSHFSGHDGVRAWLAAVDEQYEHYEVVDCEFQAGSDDSVLVSCRLRLRYQGDRYGMSRTGHGVLHVDDGGSITAFTSYRDRRDAVRAAGLDGQSR